MFWDLVSGFNQIVEEMQFCRARLYVSETATPVVITYLPGAMTITGLPPGLPSSLRFEGDNVYVIHLETGQEGRVQVENEVEAAFYRLYRTWDPRVIATAKIDERYEASQNRWKVRYDIRETKILHPQIEARIKRFIEQPQEIEFVTDGVRLRELNQWDFSTYPTRLTLAFEYPDNK